MATKTLLFTQRWGRTFVLLDGEKDAGPGLLGIYVRSAGRPDMRIGFVHRKQSGWSWTCLLHNDFSESTKRFESSFSALVAFVGSSRVKKEYDR